MTKYATARRKLRDWETSKDCGHLADTLIDRMGVSFTDAQRNELSTFLFMRLWAEWPGTEWRRLSEEVFPAPALLHDESHDDCGPLCREHGDPRDTSLYAPASASLA